MPKIATTLSSHGLQTLLGYQTGPPLKYYAQIWYKIGLFFCHKFPLVILSHLMMSLISKCPIFSSVFHNTVGRQPIFWKIIYQIIASPPKKPLKVSQNHGVRHCYLPLLTPTRVATNRFKGRHLAGNEGPSPPIGALEEAVVQFVFYGCEVFSYYVRGRV